MISDFQVRSTTTNTAERGSNSFLDCQLRTGFGFNLLRWKQIFKTREQN